MERIINEALAQFESKDRNGEAITVLKTDAPASLRESVRNAHGDRMPDDWIYSTYQSILSTLTDYIIEDMDDVDEYRHEIVDGLVDVYTADLTAWLNSHPSNVYYITEAQEEYGAQEDGFKILQLAQYMAIDEIYGAVSNYLQDELKRTESETE